MDIQKNTTGLSFLFLIILSLSLVTAQGCASSGFMGNFDPNTNITLLESCPTCDYITITIRDTSSNIIVNQENMTKSNSIFNFTVNDSLTGELGTYWVDGFSNLDEPFRACYDITGKRTIDTSESIILLILVGLAVILFFVSLWGSIVMPFANPRNPLGRVMDVSWTKYLKIMFIATSYLIFLWLMNLGVTITESLVSLTQYSGFFNMVFNVMMGLIYPLFVIMFLLFSWLMFKDLQINKILKMGLNPR